MKMELSKKQDELFRFIKEFWALKKRCPTCDEMKAGTINGKRVIRERKSRCSVHSLVQHLVEKKWLVESVSGINRTCWRVPEDTL